MDFYGVSLLTGVTGLGVMALGGLSHAGVGHAGHGHAGHGGHSGPGGHGGHGGHAGATAHGAAISHGARGGRSTGARFSSLQSLLSPRVFFALLVGFGAGGLLAMPLGEPWRMGAGILAAAAFEGLMVGPLWRFLFRFESSPAITLDASIDEEARAVTSFDKHGNGLVALDVDGQIIQLLATLEGDALARGVRIRTGDRLRIAAIDSARGQCTVRENDR